MSSKAVAELPVRRRRRSKVFKPGEHISKWAVRLILLVFVLTTVYPMLFVLLTSGKTTNDFYNNIWGLPIGGLCTCQVRYTKSRYGDDCHFYADDAAFGVCTDADVSNDE